MIRCHTIKSKKMSCYNKFSHRIHKCWTGSFHYILWRSLMLTIILYFKTIKLRWLNARRQRLIYKLQAVNWRIMRASRFKLRVRIMAVIYLYYRCFIKRWNWLIWEWKRSPGIHIKEDVKDMANTVNKYGAKSVLKIRMNQESCLNSSSTFTVKRYKRLLKNNYSEFNDMTYR